MSLLHQRLIKFLPREQLLEQLRELWALLGKEFGRILTIKKKHFDLTIQISQKKKIKYTNTNT